MSELYYIYSLTNPVNNLVYYIGKTQFPKQRLLEHTRHAKRLDQPKDFVCLSILDSGKAPILDILEESDVDQIDFWEEHYIFLYRSWGFDLANVELRVQNRRLSKHTVDIIREKSKEQWKITGQMAVKMAHQANATIHKEKFKQIGHQFLQSKSISERRNKAIRDKHAKPFSVFEKVSGDFIGRWENQKQCCRDLNIHQFGLSNALHGKAKTVNKYIAKYDTL